MARRHLSPDEAALWHALVRSVRPMRPTGLSRTTPLPTMPVEVPVRSGLTLSAPASAGLAPVRTPAAVLDNSWEKRIRGGAIVPSSSIDLHGLTLSAAHVRLNQALASALARDARVMLVVTGNPPKNSARDGSSRRGAIRGEIGHWLETSPHADRIASVRVAHPRHGGDGALYLILRRKK